MELGTWGSLASLLGTAIAIFQAGYMRANSKHLNKLQYLLAGVGNTALLKQQAWDNQMAILKSKGKIDEAFMSELAIHQSARDGFAEIASLVSGLEGAITTDHSAVTSNLENTLKQTKLNNQIQTEALKNPSVTDKQ